MNLDLSVISRLGMNKLRAAKFVEPGNQSISESSDCRIPIKLLETVISFDLFTEY